MKKVVLGLAVSEDQANRIVDKLLSSGFTNQDISILAPDRRQRTTTTTTPNITGTTTRPTDFDVQDTTVDKTKKGTLGLEKHTKAPEGATTGATAGGIIGGSIGLLAGIGALAIPGLGPFIAAGPIMAALSGSAVGGALGLLTGALVGSGIPEVEAKTFEKGVTKEGNILISVHVETDEQIDKATNILKKEGAKNVTSTKEKTKAMF